MFLLYKFSIVFVLARSDGIFSYMCTSHLCQMILAIVRLVSEYSIVQIV